MEAEGKTRFAFPCKDDPKSASMSFDEIMKGFAYYSGTENAFSEETFNRNAFVCGKNNMPAPYDELITIHPEWHSYGDIYFCLKTSEEGATQEMYFTVKIYIPGCS